MSEAATATVEPQVNPVHRQVSGLLALEDAIDVGCCLPIGLEHLNPIGHQAAARDEVAEWIDCWQLMPGRESASPIIHSHRSSGRQYARRRALQARWRAIRLRR